jgi:hypothetical protein
MLSLSFCVLHHLLHTVIRDMFLRCFQLMLACADVRTNEGVQSALGAYDASEVGDSPSALLLQLPCDT